MARVVWSESVSLVRYEPTEKYRIVRNSRWSNTRTSRDELTVERARRNAMGEDSWDPIESQFTEDTRVEVLETALLALHEKLLFHKCQPGQTPAEKENEP